MGIAFLNLTLCINMVIQRSYYSTRIICDVTETSYVTMYETNLLKVTKAPKVAVIPAKVYPYAFAFFKEKYELKHRYVNQQDCTRTIIQRRKLSWFDNPTLLDLNWFWCSYKSISIYIYIYISVPICANQSSFLLTCRTIHFDSYRIISNNAIYSQLFGQTVL